MSVNLPNQRPRVLLVEEDQGVRYLTARILCQGGYDVIERATPSEAMDGGLPKIDVLLTDGALSEKITGPELAKILRGENPELPVVCLTASAPELLNFDNLSGIAVIEKPYQPNELLKVIGSALAVARPEYFLQSRQKHQ